MRDPQWNRLFPDEDFRWFMSLHPGEAVDFFASSGASADTLALRRERIKNQGEHYVVIPPGADALIAEALDLFGEWTGTRPGDAGEAGLALEPDWVLLRRDGSGDFLVEAGVVCFPSHWSLPDKAGLSIHAVHDPVPGLNETLAGKISVFLGRLRTGSVWERENWGLSADNELDHHPRLPRVRLTGTEPLDAVWLRLERQLFVRLPGGGVLFGIRVSNHRLDEVAAFEVGLPSRIARALRTMPEEIADYKGISAARSGIARRLAGEG